MRSLRSLALAAAVVVLATACGEAGDDPLADTLVPTAETPLVAGAPPTEVVVATSATATAPATRQPRPPEGACERIATRLAEDTPTTQFVVARTVGWADDTAVLQVAERSGLGWTCGAEMVARVGRAGLRPLLDRRSGDDTTPAGVFGLGTMTAWDGQRWSFFGTSPDPGVSAGTYRRTRPGDCFGATPGTPGYGHLRYDTSCPGPDDEYLPAIGAYTNAALIGANTEPDVSGDALGEIPYAAAIFVHRSTYATPGATSGETRPTSGCVSLPQPELSAVLVQMRHDVRFAIGTTEWLLAGAGA